MDLADKRKSKSLKLEESRPAYAALQTTLPAYGNPSGNNQLPQETSEHPDAHSSSKNPEFSDGFDYVMVFPMREVHQTKVTKFCIHEMMEAGLEVFTYLSVQDDELLVLIRCPLERLMKFADQINFKLKMDPKHLQEALEAGDPENHIKPVHINHNKDVSPYTPYEHIYLRYDRPLNQDLYYVPPGEPNCFVKSIRLRLINLLLRAPKRDGGCALEIGQLLRKKKIFAYYPLHDHKATKIIMSKTWVWAVWPWNIPVEDLREYFGEKTALYFVFVGHYSYWLIIPAFIGIVFQLVVWGTLNFSSPVLPFYSLLITIWCILMLEYWKRQQATTALFWGMSEFESEEPDRPEFVGEEMKSYINGEDMTYFPSKAARQRATFSQYVVTTFVCAVVGAVAAIYVLRFYLQARSSTRTSASAVASILNTIQIQIFNLIYQGVARYLTDQENHRTDTAYEDSLIIKLFVFQFINSYASFFFLAFVAANLQPTAGAPVNYLGQCGGPNCMEPLSINLAIIFGTRLTLGNFLDIFIPWVSHKYKIYNETKGVPPDRHVTPPEEDYMLLNYETMIENINNYADTVIQYGFTVLFITALPIAAFFSLVSSHWKVKFLTWKICDFYQRPVPEGSQDIGTWLAIFQFLSVAAVITNAGLICFTMNVLWGYSWQGRLWIFIGFQWVLIFCQFFIQAVVPDVPEEVEIQLARKEFINEKIIEKVEDEDWGEPEGEDVEELDEENEEEVKQKQEEEKKEYGLCGCCSKGSANKKAKGKTKIRDLPNEYPVCKYPTDGRNSQIWPQILEKDPNAEKAKSKKQKNDLDEIDLEEAKTPREAPAVYY